MGVWAARNDQPQKRSGTREIGRAQHNKKSQRGKTKIRGSDKRGQRREGKALS